MPINILTIDTSMKKCSVALLKSSNHQQSIDMSVEYNCSNKKDHHILVLINNLLKNNNIQLNEINLLACNKGPGNFTNIRNGVCLTQGLAFGLNLPTIGVSTLAMLAHKTWKVTGASNILVAINAKIGYMFWGEYFYHDKKNILINKNHDSLITYDMATLRIRSFNEDWTNAGNSWQLYPNLKKQNNNIMIYDSNIVSVSAKDIIYLALKANKANYVLYPEQIKPVYLHNLTWKN